MRGAVAAVVLCLCLGSSARSRRTREAAPATPPPAAPAWEDTRGFLFRPTEDGNSTGLIQSKTMKIGGPMGNMLVQYAWAIAMSVLSNVTMNVAPRCPHWRMPGRRGAQKIRIKKRRDGSGEPCIRILHELNGAGGVDLIHKTPLYQQVRRELFQLPVKQSWFEWGGYFVRQGSAHWGWTWEDDPYGVLWKTRPLFRNAVRPLVDRFSPSCPMDSVVIHLRCSDIPFCRQGYTLFRHSWYLRALDQVEGQDIKVCILTCAAHQPMVCEGSGRRQSSRFKLCTVWADALATDMKAHPRVKSVEVQKCQPVENDFASLVRCRAMVSGGSSFSFTAALLRSAGLAILPEPGRNTWIQKAGNQSATPGPDSGIRVLAAPRLRHEEVRDYYDADAVTKLLRS
eukprot:Hpha_TRINITY_DN30983_c0_g1::TRINITY_DN30983_c0_g1_i1::g.112327::m.112327